jgi:hypothetical protein
MLIFKNSHAGSNPHSRGVDVLRAVVVEVQPACTHACAGFIDAGFTGNGRKSSIRVVAIENVAAKIVDDV